MACIPLYSEGRNVRKFEGHRRKETSMTEGFSCGPETQHASFPFLHNNPLRQEWFLPFHIWRVGTQRGQ